MSVSPLTAVVAIALWASLLTIGADAPRAAFPWKAGMRWAVARIVAFDIAVVPLVAWAAVTLLAVPPGFALGLLLVGMASAGPLGIVATRVARADTGLALATVGVLELANLVVIPFWSWVLLPRAVAVPVGDIVFTLAVLLVAPYLAGVLLVGRAPRLVPGLRRVATPVATASWLAAVLLAFATGWSLVGASVASGVLAASLVLMACCLAGGWLVTGGPVEARGAGALVTGQRGNAVALGIASSAYAGTPEAALVIALFAAVVSLLVPAVALVLRARTTRQPALGPTA